MSAVRAHAPAQPLRILFVATKPAYPPSDGGKLLMWHTIEELAQSGHEICFVAPDLGLEVGASEAALRRHCREVHLVPSRVKRIPPSVIVAYLRHQPLSIIRHSHEAVRRRVAELLQRERFDLIHAEQIHALSNLPDDASLPPVVVRAQNVESQLWRMLARIRPRFAWLARREGRRMAAHEAQAVARAAATVTLTAHDGAILGGGTGMTARRVRVIPPPFPSLLEAADEALAGDPAVVLVGGGWLPNRDSTAWFLNSIWEHIRRRCPGARLHVFGGDRPQAESDISWRPAPASSVSLFDPASILVVPLRVASGIRMKILEAWARGVPVIATPEAVSGLKGNGARGFILAADGAGFAAAVERIHGERGLADGLVAAGRAELAERHDPGRVIAALERVYLDALSTSEPSAMPPGALGARPPHRAASPRPLAH
jgi:polysaccharide biosynthesis protein PslH